MQFRRFGGVAVVVALLLPAGIVAGSGMAHAPEPSRASQSDVVDFGSDWRFHSGSRPADSWRFVRQDWESGTAPFGVGSDTGPRKTAIDGPETGTVYFQKSFGLADVPEAGLELTTWADDGIVAYINGTEIARRNLPTGPIRAATRASSRPSSVAAQRASSRFAIPATALDPGTNVIAVEVHAASPGTDNLSFDARIGAVSPTGPAPTPGYLAGWGSPSVSDDFTYVDPATGDPGIDPSIWNVRGRDDLGLLPDAAVANRGQVSVDDEGIAHLRARWLDEPVIRPDDQDGPHRLWHETSYLDQRVLEKGDASYAQKYGRWEIRAKVPSGPRTYGSLAAFWLRNEKSGEIDIMEAWGYNLIGKSRQRVDTATTTVHTKTAGNGDAYAWTQSDYGAEVPVWKDFHTWAFEYTPDYAALFVDDVQLVRVTPETHPLLWSTRYFSSPLHVRLNLHVGSSEKFWGLPDPAHRSWTQNLDFQVDHVRIWKFIGTR